MSQGPKWPVSMSLLMTGTTSPSGSALGLHQGLLLPQEPKGVNPEVPVLRCSDLEGGGTGLQGWSDLGADSVP